MADFTDEEIERMIKASAKPGQENKTEAEREADEEKLRKNLLKALSTLTPREQTIIHMHYGLDDGVPHDLGEIAKIYGATEKRVEEIESKALRKLMHPKYEVDDGPSK